MARGYDIGSPPVFGDVYSGLLPPVNRVPLVVGTTKPVDDNPPLATSTLAQLDITMQTEPVSGPYKDILTGDNPNDPTPPKATDDPLGDFETPPILPLYQPDKPILLEQDIPVLPILSPDIQDNPPTEEDGGDQWGNQRNSLPKEQ